MQPVISLHFRPTDVFIKETFRDGAIVKYQIVTNINFYTDEEQTILAYTKQYTFDDIPYNGDWDAMMYHLYTLVIRNK